jgi:short-subunit dehydrogenase
MKNPRSILITGGSSGIGKGLCVAYASPGVTIALNGRDAERLNEVAEEIKSKGAKAIPRVLDVTDKAGMEGWIREVDRESPLDLVIANAGISTPENMSLAERAERIFDINVRGVFNTIHPALELMRERGKGQVVIVSSIAGYIGLPWSPAYSGSKAAVKVYGEALRSRYGREGVEITVVCPGVVHTPMTESTYRDQPGWLTVDRAVRIIKSGIDRDSRIVAFPWYTHHLVRWLECMPIAFQDWIMPRIMRRRYREG